MKPTDNDRFAVHYREDDNPDGSPGPFRASSRTFDSRAKAESYAASIHPRRDPFIVNVTPETGTGPGREFLNFPAIQGMMAGVSQCFQDGDGVISLVYEDGTIETRQSNQGLLEFGSLFRIVTFVQDARIS